MTWQGDSLQEIPYKTPVTPITLHVAPDRFRLAWHEFGILRHALGVTSSVGILARVGAVDWH